MDKIAQEEMGRLTKFTKQQRHKYVDKMITGRLRGIVVINSYERMPHPPIPKPETKNTVVLQDLIMVKTHPWLNQGEAETYFSHLVSIVTGASRPDRPDVFYGIYSVDEGYEQLFIAFNQMLPNMEIREDLFGATENRLQAIEDGLNSMKKTMDNRDRKTEQTLKLLLTWQKRHDRLHAREKRNLARLIPQK